MSKDNEEPHHIVAIEAIHCKIPSFTLQTPHTKAIYNWTYPSELESRVKDATIIITTTIKLNAEILSAPKTPKLRLIVILASGTDCVDKDAARARGIPVCNCPSTNIDSVSEHAIGLYFAVRRRLVDMTNSVRNIPDSLDCDTEWKVSGSLKNKLKTSDGGAPLLCSQETMGIIGYGNLGRRIKNLADGLGMNVIIAERRVAAERSIWRPGVGKNKGLARHAMQRLNRTIPWQEVSQGECESEVGKRVTTGPRTFRKQE